MRDREEREVGLRRPTSCVDDFPDPTVKGEPGTDPHDGPEAEVGESGDRPDTTLAIKKPRARATSGTLHR